MPLTTYSSPINQDKLNMTDPTVDLGRIEIQKSLSRIAAQDMLRTNLQSGIRPSSAITRPEGIQEAQKNKQIQQVVNSVGTNEGAKNQFLEMLRLGIMGAAEGFTGRPFATTYIANKDKQKAAEQAFKQQQLENKFKEQELGVKLGEFENKKKLREQFSGQGAKPPEGFMVDPNFAIGASDKPFIPDPSFKSTDTQKTTAIYAQRLIDSENAFKGMEEFINKQGFMQAVGGMLPAELPGLKGKDLQKYEQAKRSFLNAVLRKESGAVINPSEFKEGNAQYFPMFGDDAATIEQKRKNRESVIAGFVSSSGSALDKLNKEASKREEKTPTVGKTSSGIGYKISE